MSILIMDLAVANRDRGADSTIVVSIEGFGFGVQQETFDVKVNGQVVSTVDLEISGGQVADVEIGFTVPNTSNFSVTMGERTENFTTTGGSGSGEDGSTSGIIEWADDHPLLLGAGFLGTGVAISQMRGNK